MRKLARSRSCDPNTYIMPRLAFTIIIWCVGNRRTTRRIGLPRRLVWCWCNRRKPYAAKCSDLKRNGGMLEKEEPLYARGEWVHERGQQKKWIGGLMQHRLGLTARMGAMYCALGRGDQDGEIDTINGCCDPLRIAHLQIAFVFFIERLTKNLS